MKNIWTKVGAGIAALLAGLLLTGAVALADGDASNSNTGADSTNNSSVSVDNDTTISSTNNATINNNLSVAANTGSNSASQNTGDGTVSSGDITGSISVTNSGNFNGDFDSLIALNCGSNNCNFSASNSHTGADSTNNSSVNVRGDFDITLINEAEVDNNIGADLNTGGNSADENTGDGSVSSGDIDFSIDIVNDLNRNQIGGPLPEEPPAGPGVIPQPGILPGAPTPGQVLAAAAGLPITGGNIPSWPILLVAVGFALKLLEKVFKVRFEEV